MNKYQRLIVIVALIDALVMVLFPPFSDAPLRKGLLPTFDGYYPLLAEIGVRRIDTDLLTLQLMFVGANALAAILFLRNPEGDGIPSFNFTLGIGGFVAVNLAVVLLFPPFESYSLLARTIGSSFDGFYFVWGSRSARPIFAPLLHLEIIFVAVNAFAVWLLFSTLRRSDETLRADLARLAETMTEEELAALSEEMRRRVQARRLSPTALGRGSGRHANDPDYHGSERRHGPR